MHKTQPEIKAEIKKKYGKNIKTACVICGNKIKYSIQRYYAIGNVCPKCNSKCEYILDAKKLYNKTLANSEKAKSIFKQLKEFLKKHNIDSKDLFLSIKFSDSAEGLSKWLNKAK